MSWAKATTFKAMWPIRSSADDKTKGPLAGCLEYTPPKFNIAPENWWLEDEFPFGNAYF